MGWFKAPTTGLHTFYLATDDHGELYLGPTEAQAEVICSVPGWTSDREWYKYSSQSSAPQSLVSGQFYYMRSISNEAGGGDNNAVGVVLPDGTDLKPLPTAGYVFVQPVQSVRVDVLSLGAVPDGVADSSAAFLNASAQTKHGGEILVPTGRYRTSAFNLSSNTRMVIYGDIHGVPSRRSDQALIGWTPDAHNISIVGNGTVSNRGNSWSTNRVGFVCPHFAAHNLPPASDGALSNDGERAYILGEQGGLLCPVGTVNVEREDCLAAAIR